MWDVVIGLETHVQLQTQSKIFSHSPTQFGALANHQAHAIDLALPGSLPMLNQKAVELAIKFGLAVNAKIDVLSRFDRKHYFYPDLPKGYQTSQYYRPIVAHGVLPFYFNGEWQTLNITRAHLEEDAGKSSHDIFTKESGIDLNRAGTPLLEIVTEPELTSPAQAVAYARALHHLVKWLKICDGNMQEGSFRCDANVSIKPKGSQTLGTRCEIKNLNSFRFLEEAMEAEIARQIDILESGGEIIQQTRLYNPDKKETQAMRSKEDAHDYRYFPCPDLLSVHISDSMLETAKKEMPILPKTLAEEWQNKGLHLQDAQLLIQEVEVANFVLEIQSKYPKIPIKLLANWFLGDIFAYLNKHNLTLSQTSLTPDLLGELLSYLVDENIHQKTARELLQSFWQNCANMPTFKQAIDAKDLWQKEDEESNKALDNLIQTVLNTQIKLVEEYLGGKEKALNAMIGQVMKQSQGKANPAKVQALVLSCLEKMKH